MCNLKAKKSSQSEHNRLGVMRRDSGSFATIEMPAVTRLEATPAITCTSCRAVHYQASLACRKCGSYFAHAERPAVVQLLLVPSVAATAAAIVGILATIMLGVV